MNAWLQQLLRAARPGARRRADAAAAGAAADGGGGGPVPAPLRQLRRGGVLPEGGAAQPRARPVHAHGRRPARGARAGPLLQLRRPQDARGRQRRKYNQHLAPSF